MPCPIRCYTILSLGALLCAKGTAHAADLEVPAHAAYFDPDPPAAAVSESDGINRWNDPGTTILWFGHFETSGELRVTLRIRPPQDEATT